MKARGGQVFGVSVDPPEDNARVMREDSLAFPILSDASHDAIRAFGIVHADAHESHDIAVPTQVLVAPDGRILWWRSARLVPDRPTPDEVRAALASALHWR